LDVIAGLFRLFGRHSFEVDGDDQALFREACENWARHLLLGTPLVEQPAQAADRIVSVRQWADAQSFFRERRLREEAYVQRRLREYTSLVWDLLDALRKAEANGLEGEKAIGVSLQQFEHILNRGSPEQLRKQFNELTTTIKLNLDKQRQYFEQEVKGLQLRLEQAEQSRQKLEAQTKSLNRQLVSAHEDLQVTRRQMEMDPLTRVYNRGAFDAALQRYTDLALNAGQVLALLMIDLDHFKRINDEYGHLMGDRVLTVVSDTLVRCFLRKDDFIARYGGEEFVVLLFVSQPRDVVRMVDNLLKQIREIQVPLLDAQDQRQLKVSCSIGYALLLPKDTPETILIRADRALYKAKANGRDRAEGDFLETPLINGTPARTT
jgi:diguanylate cyclase (GGDEF)-like protein